MLDLVRQATDKVRESLCIAERHFSNGEKTPGAIGSCACTEASRL